MGKIRANYIKRTGNDIMSELGDIITSDFDINKDILDEYCKISSKNLRNRIAGYLVRLKINEYRIITPPKKGKKIRSKKDRVKRQRRNWR